jgi:hypothetical protein
MADQNINNKWVLAGDWFGNIRNLVAVLSLLFLLGLAVPKLAESAPDKLSTLINEINGYALRDVQDNVDMRPGFVVSLFEDNKLLTADQISQIYKEEYTKLKGLSNEETMTTALWFVLWLILGISFVGFMVLVWMGYKDKEADGMSKGDLRKGIAVFLIVLFGSLVVTSYFPIGVNVPSEIQGIFAGAVATVIGFYFGSRASVPPPVVPETPVIAEIPVVAEISDDTKTS